MATELILIRHGDSHHKHSKLFAGPEGCQGLTDTGRDQAQRLANRLAAELERPPVAIYSSVIPRAIETAEIVASAFGTMDVLQDCGLCTWHVPPEEDGQPHAAFRQANTLPGGGVYRPFERGVETWAELMVRAGRSLETIAFRHADELVIIFTHAEIVQTSLTVFGDMPMSPGFDLQIGNTGITEWATTGDPGAWPRPRWTLKRLNDCAHFLP